MTRAFPLLCGSTGLYGRLSSEFRSPDNGFVNATEEACWCMEESLARDLGDENRFTANRL